jgi:pyridoxine 5-phosphate synthase
MNSNPFTQLSVNINKIATLRNARGGLEPNLIFAAQAIESFGAHGITIHPRPDERHIKKSDVYELKSVVKTELNIEGFPTDDFLELINTVHPEQTTLVPDPPNVLTSNAGWKVEKDIKVLEKAIERIKSSRVSVFMDPFRTTQKALKELKRIGANRIELYTESFAHAFHFNQDLQKTLDVFRKCADIALSEGLELNAGHDLNQKNLKLFIQEIPEIKEVSIGHALISESLYEGLEKTIKNYLEILDPS